MAIPKVTVRGGEGNKVQVIDLFGDKKRRLEPWEVRIQCPFGAISIARTRDGEYWCHVAVARDNRENLYGQVIDARLDIRGKHTSDVDVGDFNDIQLEHLAVRLRQHPDVEKRDYQSFPCEASSLTAKNL